MGNRPGGAEDCVNPCMETPLNFNELKNRGLLNLYFQTCLLCFFIKFPYLCAAVKEYHRCNDSDDYEVFLHAAIYESLILHTGIRVRPSLSNGG